MLTILSNPPLSLIQDQGRIGYQHLGVSVGGPMDEHAFYWANRLLDNPIDMAMIEITIGQFKAAFSQDVSFALTGANMHASLNDEMIQPWQSYHAQRGDVLYLRSSESGLRAYLAVKNGFVISPILDSVSTVMRDSLGGINQDGIALESGQELAFKQPVCIQNYMTPPRYIPNYATDVILDVILSYQHELFSPQEKEKFFTKKYTLTSQMNRMGYRFEGESVLCESAYSISEGIALGAIQIPQDGQPIILLRDRQSIGGYPKIGCLTRDALQKISQLKPGNTVSFNAITLQEAEQQYRQKIQFFGLKTTT